MPKDELPPPSVAVRGVDAMLTGVALIDLDEFLDTRRSSIKRGAIIDRYASMSLSPMNVRKAQAGSLI